MYYKFSMIVIKSFCIYQHGLLHVLFLKYAIRTEIFTPMLTSNYQLDTSFMNIFYIDY